MTIDDIAISNRMSASETFRSETTFEPRPGPTSVHYCSLWRAPVRP
jgi:hypothetical protein